MDRATTTKSDILSEKKNTQPSAWRPFVCVLLIMIGTALILASWIPIGHVASRSIWTHEDSAAYSELRQELHRTAYQSPARAGITEAQMKTQREKMKNKAEAMRKKLEHARQQPRQWSQYLLWSGALLVALGGCGYLAIRQ